MTYFPFFVIFKKVYGGGGYKDVVLPHDLIPDYVPGQQSKPEPDSKAFFESKQIELEGKYIYIADIINDIAINCTL